MVRFNYMLYFQFIVLWVAIYGKIELVLDGNSEYCNEGRNFDISLLEIIPYNDTHTILNGKYHHLCSLYDQIQNVFSFKGTFIFKNEVKAPWIARGLMEKFQNGKWQPSIYKRKIPDFCSVVKLFLLLKLLKHSYVFRIYFSLDP